MPTIIPIPAFDDNYIWLLHNQREAIVVDPGNSEPVLQALEANSLELAAILITHHHCDHIGGVQVLQEKFNVDVYAPSYGKYPFEHIRVSDGDQINIDPLNLTFRILWLPGHTLDHIAFLSNDLLFCGDVLFGAGCGRLFEGTPAQMLNSLNRLKILHPQTRVCCGHEYTARNIEFALTIEPHNQDLIERKDTVSQRRALNHSSLPSSIDLELRTNPFLRCQELIDHPLFTANHTSELAIFTQLRMLRNHF